MPDYKAPVRDISFVINEVLESEKLYQTLPGYEEATADLMNAIVHGAWRHSPANKGSKSSCELSRRPLGAVSTGALIRKRQR